MNENTASLEAILFAAGEPVPIARVSLTLGVMEYDVELAAKELEEELESRGHSLQLLRLGDKLQLCSRPEYSQTITRTLEVRKPPMLSQGALETLAIVAYFQPVTIAYVSKLRGVDSGFSVSSLVEKGLIESRGRLDAPGRPAIYCTTDAFLRTMNIKELGELPPLPDISDTEGISRLQNAIEALRNPAVETVKQPGGVPEGQLSISEE